MRLNINVCLLMILVFISCSSFKKSGEKNLLTDIIRIELTESVSFNWNNEKFEIVEDELFDSILLVYSEKRRPILEQIGKQTKTKAKICGYEDDLLLGHFAFLLIDKIEGLPYFDVFKVQFDFFEQGCNYPSGLLSYLKKENNEAKTNLELYLKKSDKW